MSHVELTTGPGSNTGALLEGLVWALLFALAWFAVHGGPSLLACWRRGRAYRQRMRRAKHLQRRDSLHHLTYRSPIRD